jgi:hypothetical protein
LENCLDDAHVSNESASDNVTDEPEQDGKREADVDSDVREVASKSSEQGFREVVSTSGEHGKAQRVLCKSSLLSISRLTLLFHYKQAIPSCSF